MTDFADQISKLIKGIKPSTAQVRKVFSTYKRDLMREWKNSKTYRSHYKFRDAVFFLVKFEGTKIKTRFFFRIPEFKEYIPEKIGRKPKKLLYSSKISDKVGSVELKQLLPKKRTKKKYTTAEKRQDSYLATLRQRAQEAQKKLKKRKDFGVKEKASRWGTKGREFESNKVASRYGTKGRQVKDPTKKVLKWGTGAPVLKSKTKKNIRYGTAQKTLDRDTRQDWGTEQKDRPERLQDNTKLIKEYKKFVLSFTKEKFLDKLYATYANKLLNFLISRLNR